MRRSLRAVLPALIVLAVLLTGCRTTSSPSAPTAAAAGPAAATGGIDPCDTLASAAVSDVLNTVAIGESKTADLGFGLVPYCHWKAADGIAELAITVATGTYVEGARRKLQAAGTKTSDVPGIGDKAFTVDGYFYPGGGSTTGRTLYVRRGDEAISIGLKPKTGKPTDAQFDDLASKILAAV